jgi:hypothetical protein
MDMSFVSSALRIEEIRSIKAYWALIFLIASKAVIDYQENGSS